MDFLSGAILLPLIGAAMHPVLGWCIQRGTSAGVRMSVIVAVANFVTALIFFVYLEPEGGWSLSGKDWWAIGTGVCFFVGQWFSIQSVKSGDLAVHSSALGIKVLVVGFLSLMVGLEPASWNLLAGVVLAVLAVFFVSGGSLAGWVRHRETVWLTVLACLFFGLSDFMTGWQAQEIGGHRWLILIMTTTGAISLVFLVGDFGSLKIFRSDRKAFFWVVSAGLLMGLQALAVNLAFSKFGQPTLSNVAFSTRGVMAVALLYLIGKKMAPEVARKQLAGAVLMMVALAVVLMG